MLARIAYRGGEKKGWQAVVQSDGIFFVRRGVGRYRVRDGELADILGIVAQGVPQPTEQKTPQKQTWDPPGTGGKVYCERE